MLRWPPPRKAARQTKTCLVHCFYWELEAGLMNEKLQGGFERPPFKGTVQLKQT